MKTTKSIILVILVAVLTISALATLFLLPSCEAEDKTLREWQESIKYEHSSLDVQRIRTLIELMEKCKFTSPSPDGGGGPTVSMQALIRIGPPATPFLIDHFKGSSAQNLIKVLYVLSCTRDRSAVFFVGALLDHKNRWVRYDAASALGFMGGDIAGNFLLKRLKSEKDVYVRSSIIPSLQGTPCRNAIPTLIAALATDDRLSAARTLYNLTEITFVPDGTTVGRFWESSSKEQAQKVIASWEEWFKENGDYLRYKESPYTDFSRIVQGNWVLDEQAKQAGVQSEIWVEVPKALQDSWQELPLNERTEIIKKIETKLHELKSLGYRKAKNGKADDKDSNKGSAGDEH